MNSNQAISRMDRTRYLCDGPEGHFWVSDIEVARRLLDIIDPDGEDWTITDTRSPVDPMISIELESILKTSPLYYKDSIGP